MGSMWPERQRAVTPKNKDESSNSTDHGRSVSSDAWRRHDDTRGRLFRSWSITRTESTWSVD